MTEITQNNEKDEKNEKLYAGKFKTVEDLENGYKNAASVFDKNKNLEDKIKELTVIPDDYKILEEIKLNESEILEIKTASKNSGLTQSQFEKLTKEFYAKKQNTIQNYENAKKEIGSENLSVLQDYVNKNYPEHVRDSVLEKIIVDKAARQSALDHRNKILNTTVAGANVVSAYAAVTRNDILKARDEHLKRPSDAKARERYINLHAAFSKQEKSAI